MPIRINLLAEQQAAEEERRRDPVKRASWIAGTLIALVIILAGINQLRIMGASKAVAAKEAEWRLLESDYSEAEKTLKQTADLERRIASLVELSADRFNQGTMLDALQRILVDEVQVTRLRAVQSFFTTEAVKARKVGGRKVAGQAASTTSKSHLVIEGRDFSEKAGGQINAFKTKILNASFFKDREITDRSLSQSGGITRQTNPETEVSYVNFKLECKFPDTVLQ